MMGMQVRPCLCVALMEAMLDGKQAQKGQETGSKSHSCYMQKPGPGAQHQSRLPVTFSAALSFHQVFPEPVLTYFSEAALLGPS